MKTLLGIVGIISYVLLVLISIAVSLGIPIILLYILVHFALKWW